MISPRGRNLCENGSRGRFSRKTGFGGHSVPWRGRGPERGSEEPKAQRVPDARFPGTEPRVPDPREHSQPSFPLFSAALLVAPGLPRGTNRTGTFISLIWLCTSNSELMIVFAFLAAVSTGTLVVLFATTRKDTEEWSVRVVSSFLVSLLAIGAMFLIAMGIFALWKALYVPDLMIVLAFLAAVGTGTLVLLFSVEWTDTEEWWLRVSTSLFVSLLTIVAMILIAKGIFALGKALYFAASCILPIFFSVSQIPWGRMFEAVWLTAVCVGLLLAGWLPLRLALRLLWSGGMAVGRAHWRWGRKAAEWSKKFVAAPAPGNVTHL